MFGFSKKSPEYKQAEKMDLDWDRFPRAWTQDITPPWMLTWLQAIQTQDFGQAVRIYDDPALNSRDRSELLVRANDILKGKEQWCHAIVDSNHPLADLLCALATFHEAIQARGTGTADTVEESAGEVWLRKSEEACVHAQKAWQKNGDPTALVLQQYFSIGVEHVDCMTFFNSLHKVDPWNEFGWRMLINSSDERWSGDPELQLNLAGYLAENAPEGHPALGVVPAFLYRRFEYLMIFERNGESHEQIRNSFYSLEHVREILKLAWDRYSAQAPVNPSNYRAYSEFMQALSLAGYHQEAMVALDRSRGFFKPGQPWVVGQDPKNSTTSANLWRGYVIYRAVAGEGSKKQPRLFS